MEFSENDKDLKSFESCINKVKGVHRVSLSMEENMHVCRIFHSEESKALEEVIRLASENGLTITNIKNLEPSLEEIFLTLTGKALRDGE